MLAERATVMETTPPADKTQEKLLDIINCTGLLKMDG